MITIQLQLSLASILLAVVSACSPGAAPVSDAPKDPSNPRAPESAMTVAQADPRPHPPDAHAGHTHTEHSDGQSVVYECPMHPEVTSNAPGLCPKCNMHLVPKK